MSDNTPLLHPVYNSVYEGTLSKKTSGRKYGLIIKVLKIHIKSIKKVFGAAQVINIFLIR